MTSKKRPLLDRRTTWQLLGVSERTLFTLTKTGQLPCVYVRGRKEYDPDVVEEFIEKGGTNGKPRS